MAFLIAAIVLLGLKDLAYLWSLVRLPFLGEAMRAAYSDEATREPHEHLPGELNPIDRSIGGFAARAKRYLEAPDWEVQPRSYQLLVKTWRLTGVAAKVCFTAPSAVVIGTLIEFTFLTHAHRELGVTLGILLALCSVFVVLAAVLRRLVIGRNDWMTSDVRIPDVRPFRDWSARNEPGANLSVYFLVVVLLSILGFASLYFAVHISTPGAFATPTNAPTRVTWFYFSATTLGTIGLGDVHPRTGPAEFAVLCQAATGPLLLSWLLAAFFAAGAGMENR